MTSTVGASPFFDRQMEHPPSMRPARNPSSKRISMSASFPDGDPLVVQDEMDFHLCFPFRRSGAVGICSFFAFHLPDLREHHRVVHRPGEVLRRPDLVERPVRTAAPQETRTSQFFSTSSGLGVVGAIDVARGPRSSPTRIRGA